MKKPLGIYVHIPFCVQKCHYCDFCSAAASEAVKERYSSALIKNIESVANKFGDYEIDSIFFGGGTPTCLSAQTLSNLLATIKKVICMLRQEDIPQFPYIEQIYSYYNWKSLYGIYDDKSVNGPGPAKAGAYTCSHCNQKGFLEAEIFPVVGLDTTTKFFCPSCLSGRVNWCVKCWEAYEIDPEIEVEDQNYVCEYCSGNRKD